MPVTINGDGSITGLSVGGLPNGTVDADTLASDAVTTNKIANSAVTPAKSTISGGISDFDTWYLTANTSGNTNPIVNNWSRWTSHGGTGTVTFAAPSSGIWTFPSTGYWHIDWTGKFENTGSQERGCNLYLYATTNNNTYVFIHESSVSLHDSGNTTKGLTRVTYIFDVTDTSTHKIKLAVGYQNASRTLLGHGAYPYSNVTFTKLRET